MAGTTKKDHRPTQAIIVRLLNSGWHWDYRIKGRLLAPRDDGRWIEYDARSGRLRFSRLCTAALGRLLGRSLANRRHRRTKKHRRGAPDA